MFSVESFHVMTGCQEIDMFMLLGDLRVSEQPVLAAIHTIWLREHNRLAEELSSRNPHWNDELLYQHARRILSSLTQHITYSEFLPRILGWDAIHKFGLELVTEGYATEYREDCDATIFNEFASAAFRFGQWILYYIVNWKP